MKKISLARAALGLLLVSGGLLLSKNASAVTFSITPSAVSNQYSGFITFQVTGLADGETVAIEKYLDANANGVIDAGEFAVQRFKVTDGQANLIGGITNINVPGDADGPNGTITSQVNYQAGSQVAPIVGQYLFRLSSPTGNWPPITNAFTVTNSAYLQSFSGNVRSSGTNVPNAVIILLTFTAQGDNELVAGTVADNSGHYSIGMPPGTYLLAAARSNYVANVSSPVLTLGAGATITTNLALLPATTFISGQVVDAANPGKGVPGVFMPLQSTDNFLAVIFTDTNGNFSAPVTADSWKLKPGGQELSLHGYLTPGSGAKADTTSGSVSGLTIPVTKAAALIYGSVKDDQNHPFPGLSLVAHDERGQFDDVNAISDANGNYAIGVSAETWDLNLDASNPALAGHVITQGTGSTNLSAGQALLDNFTVKPATNHITGQVKGSNNQQISGVGVVAFDNSGYEAIGVDTDGSGFYSLDVANGNWNVGVNCNSGTDSLSALGYPCVTNQSTNIAGADAVLNFTVSVPTAQLRGQVVDDQGHPVTFMNIFAFPTNNGGSGSFSAQTDGSGDFVIGVVGGSYTIQLNTDPSTGIGSLGLVGPSIAVTVSDGVDISGLLLIARRTTGAILVAVRNANNNAGVPGVGAFAGISANGTNYSTGNAATDNSGNVTLPVFNGQWQVSLNVLDLASAGFGPAGPQNVTISGSTNAVTFLVQPCGPPVITTISPLPNGSLGLFYSVQFQASSCYGPFTWTVSPSSTLPPGLSLSTTGFLSGNPSNSGAFNFSVRVNDGQNNTDQAFSLAIGTNGVAGGGTQWTYKPFLPTARFAPAAGVINGLVYVVGGFTMDDGAAGTLEVYNPALGMWAGLAPMHTARGRLAAGVINGQLYAAGGSTTSTLEVYDPGSNIWTTLPPMNVSRLGCAAGVISNRLYVVGGTTDSLRTLEVYDPVAKTWTVLSPMPTPRYLLAAGVISNQLYAVGGVNSVNGGSALGTLEVYDPGTDSWSTRTGMPTPQSDLAAAVINARLYAVGGFTGQPGANAQAYDPAADSWMALPPMPTSRGDLAAAAVGPLFFAIAGTPAPGMVNLPSVEEFGSPGDDKLATTILVSDGSVTAAGLGSGVPSLAKFNQLNAGTASGLTFAPASLGPFGSAVSVPVGAPLGAQIINIAPGDGENGFFRQTFVLPAGYTGIQLSLGANADFYGRAFVNGNPATPGLTQAGEITENGNAMFAINNPGFFHPGTNELLIADANYDGGASGAAFYAFVTYRPLPVLSAPTPPAGGHFQLTINGTAGQNYTVQYSLDLTLWTTLLATNSTSNVFTVTDTGTTGQKRFYRVLAGP